MGALHISGCTQRNPAAVCIRRDRLGRKLSARHSYEYPGCERLFGWCFGAADELGELCDDCAARVRRIREQYDDRNPESV